jgi:GT2 family glycosyltransferase
MNPKVAIIILNWNGWEDTIECLESLYQITYPNYEVIVVDNNSQNESIEKIKEYAEGKIEVVSNFFEYYDKNTPIKIIEYTREEAGGGKERELEYFPSNRKLILIENEKNYGFSKGNNIGIRYALERGADYVFVLNNDTVVDAEFLNELIRVGEADKEIGILSPVVYYYNNPDRIQFGGGVKLNLYMGKITKLAKKEVKQGVIIDAGIVSGAAMLIKRETLKEIGLFPLEYFLGWEDTDYCIKVSRGGWKIVCIPKAKIWHKGGRTFSNMGMDIGRVKYHTRGLQIIRRKYLSGFEYMLSIPLVAVQVIFILIAPMIGALLRRDWRKITTFPRRIVEALSGIIEGLTCEIGNEATMDSKAHRKRK